MCYLPHSIKKLQCGLFKGQSFSQGPGLEIFVAFSYLEKDTTSEETQHVRAANVNSYRHSTNQWLRLFPGSAEADQRSFRGSSASSQLLATVERMSYSTRPVRCKHSKRRMLLNLPELCARLQSKVTRADGEQITATSKRNDQLMGCIPIMEI